MRMLFSRGRAIRAAFNVAAAPRGGKDWCAIGGERVRGEATGSEHGNAAGVAAEMFELEANLRPGRRQGEALGPFENHHRGAGEDIFEAQSLEIVEAFDAVEVAVVNLVNASVDVDQSKRGAGDLIFFCAAQPRTA